LAASKITNNILLSHLLNLLGYCAVLLMML
jgi:hypothetical protein